MVARIQWIVMTETLSALAMNGTRASAFHSTSTAQAQRTESKVGAANFKGVAGARERAED